MVGFRQVGSWALAVGSFLRSGRIFQSLRKTGDISMEGFGEWYC